MALPIKIFGLQRSGTNYISDLIKSNFQDVEVWQNRGGWKHGFWRPTNIKTNILVIHKSPYAWLHSVYRYWGQERKLNIGPDLREVSFHDFLGSRLVLEAQRDVPFLYRAANPIQHWNNMTLHWMSIVGENVLHIRYESLLGGIHNPLLLVMDQFGLEPKSKDLDFHNTKKTCLPSGDLGESDFDSARYDQAKFLEAYSPEITNFVNANLDREVMGVLGYKIVEDGC